MNDEEVEERSTGTVLEFDARRGFGFILPEVRLVLVNNKSSFYLLLEFCP